MRALLAGLLLVPSFAALPAAITGSVEVRQPPVLVEPRPNSAALGPSAGALRSDRRSSVVYLTVAPQAALDLPARPMSAVLDQRDESFQPYVVAVTVGSTVEFPNSDNVFHNVFSLSRAKRFDLGRYPRGRKKTVLFDRPGVVRVFCEIHSHMNAYVLVFAHPFFALTGADGRYRIDGVPPGDYELAVWNDGEVRETRKLHVPAGSSAVQEDFQVR